MKVKSIFRFVALGVLCLVTLEGAARLDDFLSNGAPLFKPYSINTLFRPSPYGREGIPGAFFAKWHLNQLGYRGPEPSDGRINVLTFGASETFGLYESAEHEYPRLLEHQLNSNAANRYSVINAAIPGMRIGRTDYLAHAIDATAARYVVIYPSPANYIGSSESFCGRKSTPVPSSLTWSDSIRLAGKIDVLFKRVTPPEVMSALRRFSLWRASRNQVAVTRVPQETIDVFQADLACAVRVVKEHGAVPIVVTHATYFGDHVGPQDEDLLLAWRRFYPELKEEGFLDLEDRANDAARLVAAQSQVPLVDASRQIPRGGKYFADFVHFTDEGAENMASLIAPAIETTRP